MNSMQHWKKLVPYEIIVLIFLMMGNGIGVYIAYALNNQMFIADNVTRILAITAALSFLGFLIVSYLAQRKASMLDIVLSGKANGKYFWSIFVINLFLFLSGYLLAKSYVQPVLDQFAI